MTAYIYKFMKDDTMGNKNMRDILGGKGANLCEMARLGLNIPPGFTITTEVCDYYNNNDRMAPDGLFDDMKVIIKEIEKAMGKGFGSVTNPLLFSVRSGAAVSMPGMMDTVLNLGLNDKIVKGMSTVYGQRVAYDCYRRLLQMFGDVVLGIPHTSFEDEIEKVKNIRGIRLDVEMTVSELEELVMRYKYVYAAHNVVFPTDPWDQLYMAIDAVFKSWNTPRAIKYREINKIMGLKGTAVNVQTMVYGNRNPLSGTGVCFTRNPTNGDRQLYGEYLVNAQGEDVVAGIRNPLSIAVLKEVMPEIYTELEKTMEMLENHMGDMQDTEFTVENGVLYMLQTRSGKRAGAAALKIATDMYKEGKITKAKAIMMVEPRHLNQLLHPSFEDLKAMEPTKLTAGLPASPGAAVGQIVFDVDIAQIYANANNPVILCRHETSPDDISGMHVSQGILTVRGGMTSHAAVVARGWGKPCVCGASEMVIDTAGHFMIINGQRFDEGDWLSICGDTGAVYSGNHPVVTPSMTTPELVEFMEWVDEFRRMKVYANADTPDDAMVACKNGAEGIGLCRTEHMFFATAERVKTMRKMIAAVLLDNPIQHVYLNKLSEYQSTDFCGIFTAMRGKDVVIRLLDPPLHEFLPQNHGELEDFCKECVEEFGTPFTQLMNLLTNLHESNPMMGLRGCRLGNMYPQITEMQCQAIFMAARFFNVQPKIMVPLVGMEEELQEQLRIISKVAKDYSIKYKVGTMIEVPRAALQADKLARHASFFSFGTNDLTQMTYGISRDDAQAKFLNFYKNNGLIEQDPFESIDKDGVGYLMQHAIQLGNKVRPDIELGVCGEQGGDPDSVMFFESIGLDYVSCSPLRVPVARLAAAQAHISIDFCSG